MLRTTNAKIPGKNTKLVLVVSPGSFRLLNKRHGF